MMLSPNYPLDAWNQPVAVAGRALYDLGGTINPPSTTPLERSEVDLIEFHVAGPGEVPEPTHPAEWAPVEPRFT